MKLFIGSILIPLLLLSVAGCKRRKPSMIGTWENKMTMTQGNLTGHVTTTVVIKSRDRIIQTVETQVDNFRTKLETDSKYFLNGPNFVLEAKTLTTDIPDTTGKFVHEKKYLASDRIVVPYTFVNDQLTMTGPKGNVMLFRRIR